MIEFLFEPHPDIPQKRMTEGFDRQQFRIPKIGIPLVCYTVAGETISGEIFLDTLFSANTSQLLEFFNSPPPFFPLRTASSKTPILIAKDSVVKADFATMLQQFREETSAALAARKDAVLHLNTVGRLEATIIIDMPEENSRLLDLLNLAKRFLPAIVEDAYVLLNSHHLYKIEDV